MNKTQELHALGQSLWLDNITREILDNGSLRRYIDEFSITGLTSNPTIFDEAIGTTGAYDEGIRTKAAAGKTGEIGRGVISGAFAANSSALPSLRSRSRRVAARHNRSMSLPTN